MATTTLETAGTAALTAKPRTRPITATRVLLAIFLTITAIVWLFPVLYALLNSFRDYAYTAIHGYVSCARCSCRAASPSSSRGSRSSSTSPCSASSPQRTSCRHRHC